MLMSAADRAKAHTTMCPASSAWRVVSSPMPLLAPMITTRAMPMLRDRAPEVVQGACSQHLSSLYQPAETLTHRRHRLRRARSQYLIGPPYVFAMDVPVGRRQDESGSASFGISRFDRATGLANPRQCF